MLLQDGETVEARVRFDTYRGVYQIHSHQSEHEAMAMMAHFEVA